MPKPIRETRVLKLVFITIPCLKFWALHYFSVQCTVYTHKGVQEKRIKNRRFGKTSREFIIKTAIKRSTISRPKNRVKN